MQIGDDVVITDGPLIGLIGRLIGVSNHKMVVVVQIRGRDIDVEIDAEWVGQITLQPDSTSQTAESYIEHSDNKEHPVPRPE